MTLAASKQGVVYVLDSRLKDEFAIDYIFDQSHRIAGIKSAMIGNQTIKIRRQRVTFTRTITATIWL